MSNSIAAKISKLKGIIPILKTQYSHCQMCPRECRASRAKGKRGLCGASDNIEIGAWLPHHGEEPVISGDNGSGTVFFSHCPLKCVFCQNYQLSHHGFGTTVSSEYLTTVFLQLQYSGCNNLNLVSPTPYYFHIAKSLLRAFEHGFNLPVIFNTSGYERKEIVSLFNGVVDIWLSDWKFGPQANSEKLSAVGDYYEVCKETILEMQKQCPRQIMQKGLLKKGVIIRHLILPEDLADTRGVIFAIANSLASGYYFSLLQQYTPIPLIKDVVPLNRPISQIEWLSALALLSMFDIQDGWIQSMDEHVELFFPDFKKKEVFPYYQR